MKRFFKKIYKKLIELIYKFIYGEILLSTKNSKLIKKININKKFFDNKKYFVYILTNGTIFTDNVQNVAAISNNKLHSASSFQHANDKLVSSKFNSVLKKGTTNIRKKYKGTVLSLVQGASTENYFHWLMDILPKIRLCIENYPVNKIDYFYLPNLANSQKESLQYLGIDKKKIINSKSHKHITANKIIFVSHPWYTAGKFHDQSYHLPKWTINWIKKTFLKYRKKFKISKKIYLDRSESRFLHCQVINDNQVKNYLIKNGYQIIKLSKLSFAKQIFIFWNAKHIVAAHGAALTNIVFCKPNTKIIEIQPFGHPG
jgi:capsular polysaccharide biosynthesis protein